MSCFDNNNGTRTINGTITLLNAAEAIVSQSAAAAASSSTDTTTNQAVAAVAGATTTATPFEINSQRALVALLRNQHEGHNTVAIPMMTRATQEARLLEVIQQALDIVNDVESLEWDAESRVVSIAIRERENGPEAVFRRTNNKTQVTREGRMMMMDGSIGY
jgi:hypothetical protein